MATYAELLEAINTNTGQPLRDKLLVAVVVAADVIRAEPTNTPNHAARMVWASKVMSNPGPESRRAMYAVLAQNKDQTLATIVSATDAQVQTAVNAAADLLAT